MANFKWMLPLKFTQLLLSDVPRHRLARHLLFWLAFLTYFYCQSIYPRLYTELFIVQTYKNALINVICFAPVCIVVVYVFISYLLPLVEQKRFVAFLLLSICIYLAGTAVNYVAAFFFFDNVVYSVPVINDFVRRIETASWNTRWAMIIGVIAMGIAFAREWYLQSRAHLVMLKLKSKAEMHAQKSRIHPEWLFHALGKINEGLKTNAPDTTTKILNLSDLLSYSLYESDEDQVSLEKELEELWHLISLEQCNERAGDSIAVSLSGDTSDKQIAPMSVINEVVRNISTATRLAGEPCTFDLHFIVRPAKLVLELNKNCASDSSLITIEWALLKPFHSSK
jgi:hypothetical protein